MSDVRGLYAIVDLPHRGGLRPEEVLGAVLAGGCRSVQLRAKRVDTRERLALTRALAPMCAAANAAFWVNDDLEVALANVEGIRGLHVGQGDLLGLPAGWRDRLRSNGRGLGLSTHDVGQLEAAGVHAPDYVGFGPVFPTSGKLDPDPVVGVAGLVEACARSTVPVVAIGGIDSARAIECLDAGAHAVAVIGALVSGDPAAIEAKTRALHEACLDALATPGHGARQSPV